METPKSIKNEDLYLKKTSQSDVEYYVSKGIEYNLKDFCKAKLPEESRIIIEPLRKIDALLNAYLLKNDINETEIDNMNTCAKLIYILSNDITDVSLKEDYNDGKYRAKKGSQLWRESGKWCLTVYSGWEETEELKGDKFIAYTQNEIISNKAGTFMFNIIFKTYE